MKAATKRTITLLFGALTMGIIPALTQAQYFEALPTNVQHITVKSSGRDSVLVDRATPFELQATNDTIQLMYHEPMPDSIMPRSAVVIGTITLQFEDAEDIAPALEKYARKAGADWIVSFSEPRAVLTKDRWKVYRSTAILLHVLDAHFIQQSDIAYSYYEQNKMRSFAALSDWFEVYGKHYGSDLPQPEPPARSDQDEANPDVVK